MAISSIPLHGDCQHLFSCQRAVAVYGATVAFCDMAKR